MKISKLNFFICLFSGLLFFGCNTSEDPEPKLALQSVGFEGIFPNEQEFGSEDIRSSNGLTTSGSQTGNGELITNGTHVLSIRNRENGLTLAIELPRLNLTDVPPLSENSGDQLKQLFTDQYSYEMVLEKLNEEKYKATSNPNYNSISNFSVQYSSIKEYYIYTHFTIDPLDGGVIRVKDVIEGEEMDDQGQSVRKIEVIFELDLAMELATGDTSPQTGPLKGTARFKYREDFYQKEFEN